MQTNHQVVIATLISRFSFELGPGVARPGEAGSAAPLQRLVSYHITMFPRDGLQLTATPRTA